MGGMTVTEVDAGNIIVPPRQRKVNPVKEKVSHESTYRFMTRVITVMIIARVWLVDYLNRNGKVILEFK